MLVALLTFILYFLSEIDINYYNFLIGYCFTFLGIGIGNSISNLFIYKYLNECSPDEISGKVTISHTFSLKMNQYRSLSISLPVLLLTILIPTTFMTGALSSCIVYFIVHHIWLKVHKNKLKLSEEK